MFFLRAFAQDLDKEAMEGGRLVLIVVDMRVAVVAKHHQLARHYRRDNISKDTGRQCGDTG